MLGWILSDITIVCNWLKPIALYSHLFLLELYWGLLRLNVGAEYYVKKWKQHRVATLERFGHYETNCVILFLLYFVSRTLILCFHIQVKSVSQCFLLSKCLIRRRNWIINTCNTFCRLAWLLCSWRWRKTKRLLYGCIKPNLVHGPGT